MSEVVAEGRREQAKDLDVQTVFKKDPKTFVPRKNHLGQVRNFGLYKYDEHGRIRELEDDSRPGKDDEGGMAAMIAGMMRKSNKQLAKYSGEEALDTPEEQFVQVLVDRKIEKLKEMDVSDLSRRDAIIEISLKFPDQPMLDPITRRIRVSLGTPLSVFQDKIIQPVMGYERNLHAYMFLEYSDGAMFGPKNSNHIDKQWDTLIGAFAYIYDEDWTLAHVVSKKGDIFGYTYDLGDKFDHDIEVIEVLSAEDSNGEVVLLEGTGACPPENERGNYHYGSLLVEFNTADTRRQREIKEQFLGQPNYDQSGLTIASYSPYRYDIVDAQRRLGIALASKNSRRDGAKMHVMPIRAGHNHLLNGPKGTKAETRDTGDGYWREHKSTTKDAKGQRMCQVCGKTDVSLCSGCKKISYCSPAHQKSDWAFHKAECKRAAARLKLAEKVV